MKTHGFIKGIFAFTAATLSLTLSIPIMAAAFHAYDVNHDGSVTLSDYALSTMVLTGYKPFDYNRFDVNNNGIVSIADSSEIFDYAWYGASDSTASVASLDNLIPENVDIASVYDGITYLKKNCSTGATSEYTLTITGDATASTNSNNLPTPMEPDPNETAVVKLTKTDGNLIGTGTIIDDHIIATAAHCVYDCGEHAFRDLNIKIVGSGYTEIASYSPSYIHIPKEYTIGDPKYADDYALIYVEQDLSQYGKFELGYALDMFVTERSGLFSVKVSGFPGSLSPDYNKNLDDDEQFLRRVERNVSEGNIRGDLNVYENSNIAIPDIMKYNTETLPGDSGGPAYIEETYEINGQEYSCKTMVGIHVAGLQDIPSRYGWSRRIKAEQLYFYRSNTNLN